MTTPEHIGRDDVSRRELYLLELERIESLPADLCLPSARSVCLLAWDAGNTAKEEIARAAHKLLGQGAVYFCAWGESCERVHDIIDEAAAPDEPGKVNDGAIMTTWHDGKPLSSVIWYFLNSCWPDERLSDGCDAALAIVIGNPAWAREIRSAFADARAFSKQVLEEDPGDDE
ncbi:MAG: hypothetical protein AB1486_27560 [Planctomycetota bacterium]